MPEWLLITFIVLSILIILLFVGKFLLSFLVPVGEFGIILLLIAVALSIDASTKLKPKKEKKPLGGKYL